MRLCTPQFMNLPKIDPDSCPAFTLRFVQKNSPRVYLPKKTIIVRIVASLEFISEGHVVYMSIYDHVKQCMLTI